MSFFHHEEPHIPSKRCKFLRTTFKNCHTLCRKSCSSASPRGDSNLSSNYNEDEYEVFVSAVLSQYLESKTRRKASYPLDSSRFIFSPTTERWIFSSEEIEDQEKENDGEEREDFYSADSRISRCSSCTSVEAFLSAKPTFSRCSSLSSLIFPDSRRREIIREFCHCEGWPFGLCRKALMLPPLPKSPSESWLTRTNSKMIKLP